MGRLYNMLMSRYLLGPDQIVSFENKQEKVARRVDNPWKSFWFMKELMKGYLSLLLNSRLLDVHYACPNGRPFH